MLIRKIATIASLLPIPGISTAAKFVSIGFDLFEGPESTRSSDRDTETELLKAGNLASLWFDRFQGVVKDQNIDDNELKVLLQSVAVKFLAKKIVEKNKDLSESDLPDLEEELSETPEIAALASQEPEIVSNEAKLNERMSSINELLGKLRESLDTPEHILYEVELAENEKRLQRIREQRTSE